MARTHQIGTRTPEAPSVTQTEAMVHRFMAGGMPRRSR
jgi:hypothetical protein